MRFYESSATVSVIILVRS